MSFQYPAHKVRLVDTIVPGAIFTEAEKDGVYSHTVDPNKGVGYQVSEQDGHNDLRPEILNLLVVLQYVVRYDAGSDHHDNLAKEEDERSNGVDGSYTKGIGCL